MFQLSQIGAYVSRLMSGGTVEIILLIVLIVVALILLLVAAWILWKLLVLLGKGLWWLLGWTTQTLRGRSQAAREARLAAPPPVTTSWGAPARVGLSRALREARRLAGPDALRIVVVAGEGTSDLCRGLGLASPGSGTLAVAAGADTILVDASRASLRGLRRTARALPWRRPCDAVAILIGPDGIPPDAIARAGTFARAAAVRAATHLVIPSASPTRAWRILDAGERDASRACTQLAADTVRAWLGTGTREGLDTLARLYARGLPDAIERALTAAPASVVDIASLDFGGAGLVAGTAHTLDRTRPAATQALTVWAAGVALAGAVALTYFATVDAMHRSAELDAALATAARETATPWFASDIDAIPNTARVRRIAGLGVRMSKLSAPSALAPLAILVPDNDAPRRLGATLLESYLLHPLAVALDRAARERLAPSNDPRVWIEHARTVDEWLAAYEGIREDPLEVDVPRLLSAAFAHDEDAWPDGIAGALVRTRAALPLPAEGGLDVDALTELARANFVATMQRWADTVYTHSPVARAARLASDPGAHWRTRHVALADLRTALQDPTQAWLTAAEDRPDHLFELDILGRAIGLSLIGQADAVEAKAAVSRIRIDARNAAELFILPDIGPLMVRSSTGARGAGGAPALAMAPSAGAWLAFLDRIVDAGLGDLAQTPPADVPRGLVTVDSIAVAQIRDKLQIFDRFATDLPTDLPPGVVQRLLRTLASELVTGAAGAAERALRLVGVDAVAAELAERLAAGAPALEHLAEIEQWLRHRHADTAADRTLLVGARVATSALEVGLEVLADEDPLDVYVDPAADPGTVARRFERGAERLRRIYERFAAPFVKTSAQGAGDTRTVYEWLGIERDIVAYERGDPDSALSGIEGMLNAWARSPDETCAAPRAARFARDDYIVRALARLHAQLDYVCHERTIRAARSKLLDIESYFVRHAAWLWPYASDAGAPELSPSTMTELVTRLHAARDDLAVIDTPLSLELAANAAFFTLDADGTAAVRFRVKWRAYPGEEYLAEHVIEAAIEGTAIDEAGVHTWRYGAPARLRLRLAKNSPYRFVDAEGPGARTLVIPGEGNGALLRLLSGLVRGALIVGTEVLDAEGARHALRLTARITDADGAPLVLPDFSRAAVIASGPPRPAQRPALGGS